MPSYLPKNGRKQGHAKPVHIRTIEPSKSSMATSRSEIYNVFQILCCGFFHSTVFLEAQERKIVMIKTQNEGSVSCLYIKQAIG